MRARRSDGPVIDIHCHRECGPATEIMAVEEQQLGRVRLAYGSDLTRKVNKAQLEYLRPKMGVLEERLQDMDRMGVDIQAIAVAVYQYYYWADVEVGARVARIVNDELVEATARFGERFSPLGTVPLQDTDAAIAELRYCIQDLGMRGLEIGTHVEGEEISSPRLDPFWAEVERLGAAIVVHTAGHTHSERLQDHNFVNIIGHAYRGDAGHLPPHLQRRDGAISGAQGGRRPRRRLPPCLRRPHRSRRGGPVRTCARVSPRRRATTSGGSTSTPWCSSPTSSGS